MTIPQTTLSKLKAAEICTFDTEFQRLPADTIISANVRVTGTVQGVGFRPMVWRYASDLGINGKVYNNNQGVVIECRASIQAIVALINCIIVEPPPIARIRTISCSLSTNEINANHFSIGHSQTGDTETLNSIGSDVAVCQNCLEDIKQPGRRFAYPFTNCTHCGPRLSISYVSPYDRANTSMNEFKLCEKCLEEYEDPANRRFHAQPNACKKCGPKLLFVNNENQVLAKKDPIKQAVKAIEAGRIVAIKGMGGFQLALNATNAEAIDLLRQRKNRPHKPFAIMVKDIETAHQLAIITEQEEALLLSPQAPIVLVKKRALCHSLTGVAPDQSHVGIFLPTTAMHQLLCQQTNAPLVMTSANKCGEPQVLDNDKAIQDLGEIADFFLLHNREIVHRLDDSVMQLQRSKPMMLRRARGYAPEPFALPKGFESTLPVLAMGADLKNAACFLQSKSIILTQHFGDLKNIRTIEEQTNSLNSYQQFLDFEPSIVAVDCHPDYQSHNLGIQRVNQSHNKPRLEYIQHHHAHIASCLGENKYPRNASKVVGIVLDGLGYADIANDPNLSANSSISTADSSHRVGAEHQIWGGEVLIANYNYAVNFGGLTPLPLLGGDKANNQPWRNAFAHLNKAIGYKTLVKDFGMLAPIQRIQQKPIDTLLYMQKHDFNAPLSSSCGRLFDAVAYLVGAFTDEEMTYEGQAAMALEALVCNRSFSDLAPYNFSIIDTHGRLQIDPTPMWIELLNDLVKQVPKSMISQRFHSGLSTAFTFVANSVSISNNIDTVALSGGVMNNKRLSAELEYKLTAHGLNVLTQSLVPANDGGIALGQALIASSRELDRRKGAELCV